MLEPAVVEKDVERLAQTIDKLIAVQERQGAALDVKITGVTQDVSEVKERLASLESALTERCMARRQASSVRDDTLDDLDARLKKLEESKTQAWTVITVLAAVGSVVVSVGTAFGLFSGKGH